MTAEPMERHEIVHGDVGRRDRKKLATRRALRNAALQLVAERGMAHVTIEDITELADVAPRTFFNYFSTKESAVIGADPERIEHMRTSLIKRPALESPLEALRAVLVEYAHAIAEELNDLGEGTESWAQRFCIVRQDRDLLGAYAAHAVEVERIMTEAIAERLDMDPVHDLYPGLVAATVFAATRVAALYWGENGGTGSLAQYTSAAIDSLKSGLVEIPALPATGVSSRRKKVSSSQESPNADAPHLPRVQQTKVER